MKEIEKMKTVQIQKSVKVPHSIDIKRSKPELPVQIRKYADVWLIPAKISSFKPSCMTIAVQEFERRNAFLTEQILLFFAFDYFYDFIHSFWIETNLQSVRSWFCKNEPFFN